MSEDSCIDSFEEEHLQESLEHVAEVLEISSPKYRIKLATKKGDNFVGIVYRVTIEGDKNDVPVNIQTIFKVPPTDKITRQMLQVQYFFPREHLFYSEIVPVFEEFLKTKNKSLENVARCYFSSAVDCKEVICLEDLRLKGFEMRDRLKQMDFAHTSLAFHALGRLHALSFALRDQRPEIFASKITTLKETLFRPELVIESSFIFRYEELGKLVTKALAEEDPRYTQRFTEFIKVVLNQMEWSCHGSVAEPYAVLGHGDFWMNNMLFKYEKDSKEPQEIYLLDFQLARYASPAIDISYLLFCNCSQELREKHFDELIKIYHDSLSNYLLELGSDPKRLFPYEALLVQLEKFSLNSAGMAILVIPSFTGKSEDIREFTGDSGHIFALHERIERDHFFRITLRDTFKDLIDRNFI